jgi:hypothetical protein
MRFRSVIIANAVPAVVYGCGGSDSTAPETGLTKTDLNELASEVSTLAGQMVSSAASSAFGFSSPVGSVDESLRFTAVAVDKSFNVSHACPAGGSSSVAGTVTGSADQAAQNLNVTLSATRTDASCGLSTSRGTVVISGAPNVSVAATVNVVGGKPVGPQSVAHTGSFSWTRGTESGTCTVNVTALYTPTAGILNVTGTVCGKSVSYAHTAPKFI